MDKRTYYGSGKVFVKKWENSDTFPTNKDTAIDFAKTMMIDDNQPGFLKNGFVITTTTDKLTDKSDLGEMEVDLITKETTDIKYSLFNANAEVISKLYPTAHYSDGLLEVGGLGDMSDDEFVICFYHSDTQYGDTVVLALGKNTEGFEQAWTPDSVTPFNCNWSCKPYNDKGRLYMVLETEPGYNWTA